MSTDFLNSLVTESSTVFVFDIKKRFCNYFCSLLDEKKFPPEKEKAERLKEFGVDFQTLIRKPYFILSENDYLISFAKEGDILFLIYTDGDDSYVRATLRTAKALGLKTVLLSKIPLKEAEPFADYTEIFDCDNSVFDFCRRFATVICNCTNSVCSTPFPIEHCGLSHSAFGKALDEKVFAAYKENGISHMEISFGQYSDTISLDFKEYKRLADKYGITLWSYHLPFAPFSTINPAHFDETVRNFTVGLFIELMKEAKRDAGIKIFVMHASGEPIHEDDRAKSLKQLKKSLCTLAEFADQNDIILAVENLPRSCLGRSSEDMHNILNMHPSLKMCFDVNHLSTENTADVIKRFAKKIVTLHISDYMGKDECHLMPGEGIIDWVETIRTLKAVGYGGPFLYEISRGVEEDGAIWAKEAWHTRLFTRERFLTHSDVKENFITLMNKSK